MDLVGFSEVHPQGMRPFLECPHPLFLALHPLFWGSKSPLFSTFFVFFYIDFVFFFMIFAYFPIFLSNFLLEQTQIGRFRESFAVFLMIIPCKFRRFFRSVRLKLSCTPFCTVEFIQHTLLSGWNYPARPSVWLKLSSTPSCTVEIILYTLLYGWNYPVHPSVWFNLPSTPWKGRSS